MKQQKWKPAPCLGGSWVSPADKQILNSMHRHTLSW